MCKIFRKHSFGFTLVELLVATSIFTVFMGAAFTLYRQGGKMFSNGSWRQLTQKKAESFFNIFRDKVSRSTSPLDINEHGQILGAQRSVFNVREGTITPDDIPFAKKLNDGKDDGEGILLAYFPIWISPKYETSGMIQGVLMHNLLIAKRFEDYPNVFMLEFRSAKDSSNLGTEKHNQLLITQQFGTSEQPMDMTKFRGNPADFGLGSEINVYKLNDVASMTISLDMPQNSHGGSSLGSNGLLSFNISLNHPKDEKIVLNMNVSAPLDSELGFNKLSNK